VQLTPRTVSALAVALGGLLHASAAAAQVAQADLRSTVLLEPAKKSRLTVVTPSIDLAVQPTEWLDLRAGYEADIVTGATEAVKVGPIVDLVTQATSFDDTRHLARGGVSFIRKTTRLAATYSYGKESDYRSQSLSVSAAAEFLQKNTELEISYARGFDDVCTSAYTAAVGPSARARLDSSDGCFTQAENRATRDIDVDVFQAGWTQAWTPTVSTQMVLTGSLQHGFLENPYRGVVITPAGQDALENHPDNRARGALALRGKYYVKPLDGAVTVGVRLYRDTWDILGQTYELEAEKYLGQSFRLLAHGRYYSQTGALFYSNDYTGGEPLYGPRGQYWTGDRELSPLSSFLLGGRALLALQGSPGDRVLGVLLRLQASAGFDLLKTNLKNFTWGTAKPDDTTSMILSLGVRGEF
jgi:hypothetical protein